MAIEKKLKNFGKRAAIGTALVVSLAMTGCGIFGKGDDPVPPKGNQAPQITLGVSFEDGLSGEVDYTVCGDDNDGNINYLEVWTNGNYSKQLNLSQENPFCVYPSPGIIQETNTLEAIATDDDGAESTLKTENFYSPTEAEAREKIEGILDARLDNGEFRSYEIGGFVWINLKKVFRDFQIIRNDGKTIAINYVSHSDDYDSEMENKDLSEQSGTYSLYTVYLPENEIDTRVNSFLDSNL